MATRARGRKSAKGKVRGKPIAKLPKQSQRKRRPGIGHNSGEYAVPDETILRAINTLRAKKKAMEKVQEELDQARGVYRSARKAAKNDGLNLDAFDLIEKLERQDQGTVLVNHADAGRYLKLTESPLALQMDLFQNLEAPKPEVDVAMQGYNAGKNAEPVDNNPHVPGSTDFVLWAENHAKGIAEATAGFTKQ